MLRRVANPSFIMRTHLLLGLFCTSLFFTACAQGKKAKKPNGTSGDAATPIATKTSNKPGRDITSMTMRRTGCFGRCPSYIVELFSDGRARYVGEQFTNYLGTYEKNVGAAKVQAIFRQAQALRVDTCAEEYPMLISDLPGLIFTFTRPQGTQSIQNAHFGPRYFKSLAADVDSLAKVDGTWRKTAASKANE